MFGLASFLAGENGEKNKQAALYLIMLPDNRPDVHASSHTN